MQGFQANPGFQAQAIFDIFLLPLAPPNVYEKKGDSFATPRFSLKNTFYIVIIAYLSEYL